MTDWTPLLTAVVGSHAYGLATPDSDVDRLTVAIAPSEQFFGFNPPVNRSGTWVEHEPEDHVTHELGKFLSLALKCNPSIMEVLWLPEWELMTPRGRELVNLRRAFLSRQAVRDAYFGYALQQFIRLKTRGDGTFSSDTRNRSLKHARHLIRLAKQGLALYTTGEMTVKVDDPEHVFQFAQDIVNDPDIGESYLHRIGLMLDEADSPLPEKPASEEVEEWLKGTRLRHLLAGPVE